MYRAFLFVLAFSVLLLAACETNAESKLTPTSTLPVSTPTATPAPTATPTPAVIDHEGLYLIEVGSGTVTKVSELLQFSVSPDDETIALTDCCDGESGIHLFDLSSGVKSGAFSGRAQFAAWSPDSAQIAFVGYGTSAGLTGPSGIYVMNANGTSLRQLSDESGVGPLLWSPDGERLAFSMQKFTSSPLRIEAYLHLLDVSTGEIQDVSAPLGPAYNIGGPMWSPDGSRLAFTGDYRPAEDAPGRFLLYVYDSKDGSLREVAENACCGFDWSPDGTRLLFRRADENRSDFYTVTADGSEPPKLILPDTRLALWSPDGDWIAHLSEGCITDTWDIYATTSDGTSTRRLTQTPKAVKFLRGWLPTSDIVFTMPSDRGEDLVAVNVDGGETRKLVSSGLGIGHVVWSSDGRFLVLGFGAGGRGVCD